MCAAVWIASRVRAKGAVMQSWFSTATRTLVAVFIVASLAVTAYEWWYVWPAQECERTHDWWDAKDHQCLSPIPVWRITGHMPSAVAKP